MKHSLIVLFVLLIVLCSDTSASESVGEPDGPPAVVADQNREAHVQPTDPKGGKKPEDQRYRLLPIPMVITEPAIGKGLGLALALFHPVKEGKSNNPHIATPESLAEIPESREAPPVVSGVAGAYTNNDTWVVGAGHSNNWRNDTIRYAGVVAAARINSEIYILNIPVNFSMESSIIYQDLKFRLGKSDFMLGAGFSYINAENEFGIGLPEMVDEERFSPDIRNVGFAAKMAYETRDNSMNPRAGQLIDLGVWRYDEAIGGNYNYWAAKLKALSFHSLSEKMTLGLRMEFEGVDGRAPFFAVPFVKLRGVPALRYQNKVVGAVEIEGRYLLAPRWEVSVFGGLGYTSDDIPFFENPDSIYNYGVGGRYNIFQAHRVWLGLDIAKGPEDWNWYIQVGHAW